MNTKKEIIDELRRVASLLGTRNLTEKQYRRHGTISIPTVLKIFGTWSKAVQAAGLELTPSGRSPGILERKRKESINEMRGVASKLGSRRLTQSQLRKHGASSPKTIEQRFGTWNKAVRAAGLEITPSCRPQGMPKRGKKQIFEELRRVAAKLGTRMLTAKLFEEHGSFSISTARRAFGSWGNALEAAGLEIAPPGGPPREPKHSNKDMIAELRRVARKLGTRRVSEAKFRKHGTIGVSAIRWRFGTWNKAVKAAGLKPNPRGPSLEMPKRAKKEIIDELRRVAAELDTRNLTVKRFREHSNIGFRSIRGRFGTWNRAVKAAGLEISRLGLPPEVHDARKKETIEEIRRVASELGTRHLTANQFKRYGYISVPTVRKRFGSWNKGVKAAGLDPTPQGTTPEPQRWKISEDDLLGEIVRLAKKLGKNPSEADMKTMGRFSPWTYYRRWGTFVKARQLAYSKLGQPKLTGEAAGSSPNRRETQTLLTEDVTVVPKAVQPKKTAGRRQMQIDETTDFRGLRFAPINVQDVIHVFEMVSRELDDLTVSTGTDRPNGERNGFVDEEGRRWKQVRVEFEYKSTDFRKHGHSPKDCDLIVCWIHDWKDCPVEVLELRSQIARLPNR